MRATRRAVGRSSAETWQALGFVDAPPPAAEPPPPVAPAAHPDDGPTMPPPGSPRRAPWHPIWIVLMALLLLSVTAVGAAGVVRAPYVVYAPGSAIETTPAISAPGTETFTDDGEILFLTVSLRGASRRVGYLETLWGWIRDDHDVFPRRAILGDQTGQENRERSVAEMGQSQMLAATVALEELGYDVDARGTGAIFRAPIDGTPAAEVLEPFDVITALGGEDVTTDAELREAIEAHEPGDVVEVDLERGEDRTEVTVDVELTSSPDAPDRALLGVTEAGTRDLTFDLPFPVEIDTDDVGGPSAGLALTLGILDILTPGSITGGVDVAVTGTIDLAGVVGQVGGVGQKAVAATSAGAELLLVPAGEAHQAERFAGEDVEVVGVETLDDALDALEAVGGNARDLDRPG